MRGLSKIQAHKRCTGQGSSLSPRIPERFEVLSVDLVGPLPETDNGNIYLLTVMDVATGFFEMFSLKQASAEAISTILLLEVFLRYGFPKSLRCDNGTQFISSIVQQLAQSTNIHLQWVANYIPRANPIERKHRDLKQKVAILVQECHKTWDIHLPSIRWSINSTPSSMTGYTPILLTFGRDPRQPRDSILDFHVFCHDPSFVRTPISSFLQEISQRMQSAKDALEKAQDERRSKDTSKEFPTYRKGDQVLLKTHPQSSKARAFSAKLAPKREGVYEISKVIGPTIFGIWDPVRGIDLRQYHADHLTPFPIDPMDGIPTPLPVIRRAKRGRPLIVLSVGASEAPTTAPAKEKEKQGTMDKTKEDSHPEMQDTLRPEPRDPRLRQGPRARPARFHNVQVPNIEQKIQELTVQYSSGVVTNFHSMVTSYISIQNPGKEEKWEYQKSILTLAFSRTLTIGGTIP